ncbi:MAG: SlyX family protein [Pontiella sp.]|nr:SlyX family protein [Pontiella sp.]
MEDRINQLEALSAQQDATLQSLHQELFRQQQDLAALRRHVALLEQKIARMENEDSIAENERPPHW